MIGFIADLVALSEEHILKDLIYMIDTVASYDVLGTLTLVTESSDVQPIITKGAREHYTVGQYFVTRPFCLIGSGILRLV